MDYTIVSEEGFMQMYDANYEKIYNYVFFRLLNISNTEDLVSEIFLRAFSNRAKYDKNKASLTTWLLIITKNIIIDYYRKNKSLKTDEISECSEMIRAEADVENECIHKIEFEDALAALQKLGDIDRSIVYLRYFMDFSYREIAEHVGLSEKNVSVILSRAMKKLRVRYKEGSSLRRPFCDPTQYSVCE